MNIKRSQIAIAAALCAYNALTAAHAQSAGAVPPDVSEGAVRAQQSVIVTGTRSSNRTQFDTLAPVDVFTRCLLYTSPSPRDQRGSRMPSSA